MNRFVIDNFAPIGLIHALDANWPSHESGHWHAYAEWGKLATKDVGSLPHSARLLLAEMARLDVPDAWPDIDELHGAGLHELQPGGNLGLHLDAERHPLKPWRREASAVLYLDDCNGGEFELCDSYGATLESIESKTNRLVLFSTPGTWHRVAPVRSLRRSLCLFFWRIDDSQQGKATAHFK